MIGSGASVAAASSRSMCAGNARGEHIWEIVIYAGVSPIGELLCRVMIHHDTTTPETQRDRLFSLP
jgi:hypothetical protein